MSEAANQEKDSSEKGVKRKKKRSSMQMAKKYARRSERGSGSELDSDTYQYMVRILDILRQDDFPTMDEKLVFVDNVYVQTVGREIEFARNQVGSRVLDSLIVYASYDVVKRFADKLGESLRPLCSDRFASHVVEKIINVCADRGNRDAASQPRINKDSINIEDSEKPKYNDIALKLCRYVVNNFEEFVWDTYANHVMRTVLECLGGALDRDDAAKGRSSVNFEKRRPMAQEYTDLLLSAGNWFLKLPQLAEFGKDELTSGLLQTILRTLKGMDSKLDAKLIKRIITECFTENTDDQLSTVFHTESSVRLLEACLSVAKPDKYTKMYRRFFAGKLGELSLMPGANFAVQRLLDNCEMKEEFEEMFEELTKHLSTILDRRNTGIFASLANACKRLQCNQGAFVNVIMKTLGLDNSGESQLQIVPVVATLQSYEKVVELRKKEGAKLPVHLHGSIVLQAMLNFNKPIKIVNSMLAMQAKELVEILSDPKGSRVLDAFMDSKFIGEKSREKLAKNLQGHWVDLACGIHGSRCLDKIWVWSKTSQNKQRSWIMEELASVGESLNSTKTGKLISSKFNVPLYARNKQDWWEVQDKEDKTKALFADIIGTTVKAESKKSKKA